MLTCTRVVRQAEASSSQHVINAQTAVTTRDYCTCQTSPTCLPIILSSILRAKSQVQPKGVASPRLTLAGVVEEWR